MHSVFIVEPFCVWRKHIGIFCYLVNDHWYHHTSVYNSNLVFVMILHQKVINGKELSPPPFLIIIIIIIIIIKSPSKVLGTYCFCTVSYYYYHYGSQTKFVRHIVFAHVLIIKFPSEVWELLFLHHFLLLILLLLLSPQTKFGDLLFLHRFFFLLLLLSPQENFSWGLLDFAPFLLIIIIIIILSFFAKSLSDTFLGDYWTEINETSQEC